MDSLIEIDRTVKGRRGRRCKPTVCHSRACDRDFGPCPTCGVGLIGLGQSETAECHRCKRTFGFSLDPKQAEDSALEVLTEFVQNAYKLGINPLPIIRKALGRECEYWYSHPDLSAGSLKRFAVIDCDDGNFVVVSRHWWEEKTTGCIAAL